MHLDPGVNRLRFNITSIHQTDSRPVAPDIVIPICVILQQWERGSNQQNQQFKHTEKGRVSPRNREAQGENKQLEIIEEKACRTE